MAEPSIENLEVYVNKVTPIRQHFEKLKEIRDQIVNINTSIIRNIYQQDTLVHKLNANYQLYITNELIYPILFKSNGEIKPIANYELRHLKNSIIRTLLISDNTMDIREKMNCMTYILYYFHFIKCSNMDDLSANVVDSVQSIIRLIVEKDLTLYRNARTKELLYSLDWKLKEEKMTKAAFGLNLRR